MRNFSKSKLLALRQCAKRLWLEVNRPELREDSASTQTSFQVGHQVGDVARQISEILIRSESTWHYFSLIFHHSPMKKCEFFEEKVLAGCRT